MLVALFVVDSSFIYNALLGHDWIHSNMCLPSSLHQLLILWDGDKVEIVYADKRPLRVEFNTMEA